jgi:hypothetical protein
MPEATVTSKGQITNSQGGARPTADAGDRVRPPTVDVRGLFGLLEYAGTTLGIAEMDEVIRDAASDSCGRDGAG